MPSSRSLTGWLLDRYKAEGNVTAGYAILFVLVCAFAYLVALRRPSTCWRRGFEPIPAERTA